MGFHPPSQALFLKTYQGTQLEHRCTCCVLKPPDEVCDECDFSVYDASVSNPYYSHDSQTWLDSGSSGSSSSDGRDGVGHASSNSSSDRSSSSSSTTGGRSKASTADTPGSYGLSEQCGRCVVSVSRSCCFGESKYYLCGFRAKLLVGIRYDRKQLVLQSGCAVCLALKQLTSLQDSANRLGGLNIRKGNRRSLR